MIILKSEDYFMIRRPVKLAGEMANSEDPDQTPPSEEQSDLGLHCLPGWGGGEGVFLSQF